MDYLDEIRLYHSDCEQEIQDKKVIEELCGLFPDTVLKRENRIAHFTASGLVLNERMDKMLMVFHNIYKTWTWTGGHADGERDMYAVAKREVEEETGLTRFLPFKRGLMSIDTLTVNGHWKNGEYVPSHLHLNLSYIFLASEKESIRMKSDENQGVKWIPITEIAKYSTEAHIIPIYKKIIGRAIQKNDITDGTDIS